MARIRPSAGVPVVPLTAGQLAADPTMRAAFVTPDQLGVSAALLNFGAANFRRWTRALIDVQLGAADAKLLCVGDSTTAGIRSSTDTTIPANRSWPAQFAALMNARLAPTAKGLATPKSYSASQTADQRWTGGTGWSLTAGSLPLIGFGGKGMAWQGSGVTAGNLVFADPTVTADRFDVYYVINVGSGSAGTFTATATGGTAATVNTATGTTKAVGVVTVAAAAPGTANTVTIAGTVAARNVYIVGVEPWLSGTRQVRIGNAGAAGSAASDWVSLNGAANTYGGLDAIRAYAPHLTVIDLGINDAGSAVDAATYLGQLQQIIGAAQVSGDVILKTMLPSNPAITPNRVPLETAYVAGIKGLGLPVVDVFARIGSWAPYFSAGYMNADGVHGNDYSYGHAAQMVLAALRAA